MDDTLDQLISERKKLYEKIVKFCQETGNQYWPPKVAMWKLEQLDNKISELKNSFKNN